MIKVTFVTTADCSHCDETKEALHELAQHYPDATLEEVDASSEQGQELIIQHGIIQSPGILVNSEFFSMGAPNIDRLRTKLNQMNKEN